MFKKIITLVILVASVIAATIYFAGNETRDNETPYGNDLISNYPYIDQMLLQSSKFTQPDTYSKEMLDNYHDNFNYQYSADDINNLGYETVYETDQMVFYFEINSFSLLIKNKETGYFWSSRAEYQEAKEANSARRHLLNSGIHVTYANIAVQATTPVVSTGSLYTLANKTLLGIFNGVTYASSGDYYDTAPSHLKEQIIVKSSYDKACVEVTYKSKSTNGFVCLINIKALAIKFEAELLFSGNQFSVSIDDSSVEETGDRFRLMDVAFFPFMGATKKDQYPAYAVIPDGIGALVRLDKYYDVTKSTRFYGADASYDGAELDYMNLPIYGIVHEPDKNAFYVEINEGDTSSFLNIDFWGAGTTYNRLYSSFNFREIYELMINRKEFSYKVPDNRKGDNYKATFNFLSEDDANYFGIAADYRDSLIKNEKINQNEKANTNNDIPINLTYIMAETEPVLFGSKQIVMTKISDIASKYVTLKDNGLTNQQITLYGWSNEGGTDYAPYSFNAVESASEFRNFTDTLSEDDNTVYLYNEYTISTNVSPDIFYNTDVASNLSKLRMDYQITTILGDPLNIYNINPEASLYKAKRDIGKIDHLGVTGLSIGSLGNVLFSFYDGEYKHRYQELLVYKEIASLYDNLILSNPGAYMYEYIDGYMDLAIDNAQFNYYTDLVPLVPIVLKGSVSYYSDDLNFTPYGDDYLLMMIDFGINPSYILTEENTANMRYTRSFVYYSTTYKNYESEIIRNYNYLNDALSRVINVKMKNRSVHEVGLVEVQYENNVSIFVNYNQSDKILNHNGVNITVPAKSYLVV